jgi:hypothetical protein
MSRFHVTAATVVALALGFAAPALAADPYARAANTGEAATIDNGPGGQGSLVRGGRVAVAGNGAETQVRHRDTAGALAPRHGQVPVTVGSGESSTIVWVPAGMDPSRLALIGPDGSLPDATGGRPLRGIFGWLSGRV